MPHPLRNCIGCGQVDDHPRYVTDEGNWHHDCHSRSAFADDYSTEVVRHSGGLTGDALRAHINEHDPVGALLKARESGQSGQQQSTPAEDAPQPTPAAPLNVTPEG